MAIFMDNVILVIPAREASTRFPGKIMHKISGKPMISHVYERAKESGIKNIIVATETQNYVDLCKEIGINAILTSDKHQSGTDRVFEAVSTIDPDKKFDYVINLQGDTPLINPKSISAAINLIRNSDFDITTVACKMPPELNPSDPNNVQAAVAENKQALYFSRSPIPYGSKEYLCHIGLYVFTRSSLEKFVSLKPSKLELLERLEQLRALENHMKIGLELVEDVPVSVDVPEDIAIAEKYLAML